MPEEAAVHRPALTWAANACMFIFGVVLLLMGSLLPSLQVSYGQAGHLGSLPLVGILVATLCVGPALDLVGAKPVLVAALVLVTAALGVMPTLHTYTKLAVAALVYGFGGGLLNTATNALVSQLNVSGRSAALNLLGFSFGLGAVSVPLLMSSLGGGLQSSAVIHLLAVATALVLIPVLVLRFPRPTQAGASAIRLLRVLNQPVVWLFGALLFFESGNENCMFVWSSKIVADALRTSPRRANLVLLALSATLTVGRLLAVFWLRWLSGRRIILLSTLVVGAGVLIACARLQFIYLLTGIMAIGLGMSAIFPTALGLAGDEFPAETGTVFGAIMTVALVGGTLGPTLGAWIARHGPLKIFWVPAGAAAVIAALTLALAGRSPGRSQGLHRQV